MIVTLSVVLLVVLLLLPLTKTMIKRRRTAPPATHTQGCVYHSCCSVVVVEVVVVVLLDDAAVSCAHAIACVNVSSSIMNTYLKEPCLIKFFILMFLVNESVLSLPAVNNQQLRQVPGDATERALF